ncbi:MAG TPA: hypothetical protein VL970_12830 [Candidatus Acidoferrales bacterium]|nr:hypothetical protein [Candidatus Acidoferrales bacterium]
MPTQAEPTPWELANRYEKVHRFATLFTAQDVRDRLSSDQGLDRAVAWCQATGVKHVFVEAFRDGYQANAETLAKAKRRFADSGFTVSGCVTTTGIGKKSTGWDSASCMTDPATQRHLKSIFEFAAAQFDEIIIDDFLFTDCSCPACEQGRQSGTVTIEGKVFPTDGNTWEDYRCKLMEELSRSQILGAARAVNPKVKIIIKYPQWYDDFQSRGYVVDAETREYSRIWVGTETRDYAGSWGGTPQYEGYFIMRWLGAIGGPKCGGGWFDWLGTTEKTYVEQARQTILGGARESFLFCYGGLQSPEGAKDVEALRANLPELFEAARQVSSRKPVGIAAYKPISSAPQDDKKIYDFVGMLGLPLVPCHEFPTNAPAAFFPAQALKDSALAAKLQAFMARGKPVLITDGLAKQLSPSLDLKRPGVQILETKGQPASLLNLSQADLDRLRNPLLAPLKQGFSAPNKVALYLFSDGSWVIENFNDTPVQTSLSGQVLEIPARGWKLHWRS